MSDAAKNKGGRPATDVDRMARLIQRDLDRAALDPGLGVTQQAVLERTGIKRSTLNVYSDDPRIAPLLIRLDEMQRSRRAEKALVASAQPASPMTTATTSTPLAVAAPRRDLEALDDHQVALRYVQATQKAAWAAQRLTARYRGVEHVSNLPAAVYHLERAVNELQGVLGTLRPLAQEWLRRQGGQPVTPLAQREFDLDETDHIPAGS